MAGKSLSKLVVCRTGRVMAWSEQGCEARTEGVLFEDWSPEAVARTGVANPTDVCPFQVGTLTCAV